MGILFGNFPYKANPTISELDKQTVFIRLLVYCMTAMIFGTVGHCCSSYTAQKIGFTQIYSRQIWCKKCKLEGNQRQRW